MNIRMIRPSSGRPWTVRVENACRPHVEIVALLVGDGQNLAEPLRLVGTAAFATDVHVPVVRLQLWVYLGVAVDLAGACVQYSSITLGRRRHEPRAAAVVADRERLRSSRVRDVEGESAGNHLFDECLLDRLECDSSRIDLQSLDDTVRADRGVTVAEHGLVLAEESV